MTATRYAEVVHFRLFTMPCCGTQICWVNPRLPNYCPECGAQCYMKLKTETEHTLINDTGAVLKSTVGKEGDNVPAGDGSRDTGGARAKA